MSVKYIFVFILIVLNDKYHVYSFDLFKCLKIFILNLLINITVSLCERRIVKGKITHGEKRYMVYLVRSDPDMSAYDSWLCGGALVTTSQILTAASCIIQIAHIYAIAGYRKYVSGMDLDKDNCTRLKKNRIVKMRAPRENLAHLNNYTNTTQWMTLDIGVATVEKPYDFKDVTFRIHCSYIPTIIQINYNNELDTKVETNVIALGWGRNSGTSTTELGDRNSETLQEVSIKIQRTESCIEKFYGNGLSQTIAKYMICTDGKGLIDGEGYVIDELEQSPQNRCERSRDGNNSEECVVKKFDSAEIPEYGILILRKTAGAGLYKNNISVANNTVYNKNYNTGHATFNGTRRQGICQNDHGGPLITWVGTTELLIGVAMNSLYDDQYNCIGPYLFFSTAAAGEILHCLLSNRSIAHRVCSSKINDNFNIIEDGFEEDENKEITTQTIYDDYYAK